MIPTRAQAATRVSLLRTLVRCQVAYLLIRDRHRSLSDQAYPRMSELAWMRRASLDHHAQVDARACGAAGNPWEAYWASQEPQERAEAPHGPPRAPPPSARRGRSQGVLAHVGAPNYSVPSPAMIDDTLDLACIR